MAKLKAELCPTCKIEPLIKRVGDHRTLAALYCRRCGRTVGLGKGRYTVRGAIREWNRMLKKTQKKYYKNVLK